MGFVRVQWHCIQSWTRGPVSPSCGGGEKVISYSRSSSITDYLTHPETVLHSLDCLNQGNLPPPQKKPVETIRRGKAETQSCKRGEGHPPLCGSCRSTGAAWTAPAGAEDARGPPDHTGRPGAAREARREAGTQHRERRGGRPRRACRDVGVRVRVRARARGRAG